MKCNKCNAEVNVLDSFCPSCGASQSLLDDGPAPMSSNDSFLDKVSSKLDRELQCAEEELFGSLSSSGDQHSHEPNLNQSLNQSHNLFEARHFNPSDAAHSFMRKVSKVGSDLFDFIRQKIMEKFYFIDPSSPADVELLMGISEYVLQTVFEKCYEKMTSSDRARLVKFLEDVESAGLGQLSDFLREKITNLEEIVVQAIHDSFVIVTENQGGGNMSLQKVHKEFMARQASSRGPQKNDSFSSQFLAESSDAMNRAPTPDSEVLSIADRIFRSRHIQENSKYREIVKTTEIDCSSSIAVNAYATQEKDGTKHYIVMHLGLLNAYKLTSLFFAHDRRAVNDQSRELFHQTLLAIRDVCMANYSKKEGLCFPSEYVKKITFDLTGVTSDRLDLDLTNSADAIYEGAVAQVIAHELGHLVYGHTAGYTLANPISRNQERDADSFAASISNSVAFTEYMLLGGVVSELVFTHLSHAPNNSPNETTHPHTVDRLFDYIHANKEMMKELCGIDKQNIERYLPDGFQRTNI